MSAIVLQEDDGRLIPFEDDDFDRSGSIEEINREIYLLMSMMQELRGIVENQKDSLVRTEVNLLSSGDSIGFSEIALNESQSLNRSSTLMSAILLTVAGTAIGCGIGGTVAVAVGIKPIIAVITGAGCGFILSFAKR